MRQGSRNGGKQRGGRMGGNAMGSGGFCICPKCDRQIPHQAGTRCIEQRCPQCGKALVREGSEHHEKILKSTD